MSDRTGLDGSDEAVDLDAIEARATAAENRALIKDRAANEKANIASRRSICEQSDRFKSERDSLAARLAEVEAERDAARAEVAQLTEFGVDLAVHEKVVAQLAEARRQWEELRDERAILWPAAQVLPTVQAQHDALLVERKSLRAQLAAVRELHRPGTMTDELYFPDCWRCPNPADCEGHEVTCCTACYGRDEYGESAPIPWPCPTAALTAVPGLLETHSKPELSSSAPVVTDHAWIGVAGHPDDDECTNRNDGTDETYCGRSESEHAESTR